MNERSDHVSPAGGIIRATGIVALIAVAVKVLGFGEKILLAYYFGTGAPVDAYLVAFSVPFMIFIIVRELIEPAFLPTFMESMHGGGERSAWRLFSTVMNVLFVACVAVTLACVVAAPSVVSLFAPGFHDERREIAIRLTRILMPASLFLALSAVTYITLNAYKRFTIPALGDLLFKGIPLVVLAAAHRALGVVGLAAGVVAGACARLCVHAFGLWKRRTFYRPIVDGRSVPAVKMRRLMMPLVVGIAFSQLSTVVDNVFASTLAAGSVSSLAYAKKLVEMPIVVLPYALGVVIFPYFSELAISRRHGELFSLCMEALKALAFLFVPLAVGAIVLRVPLVRLLFERGAFDEYSTGVTSSALLYYAPGLLSFAVEVVLVQFYFSIFDTRTPIVVGVLCVLLNVAVTVLLLRPLGARGIALSLTVSKSVKVVVLYVLLRRKFSGAFPRGLPLFLCKVLAAGVLMGWCLHAAARALAPFGPAGFSTQAVRLTALCAGGFTLYLVSLLVLRTAEVKAYSRYIASNRWQMIRRGGR